MKGLTGKNNSKLSKGGLIFLRKLKNILPRSPLSNVYRWLELAF